MGMVAKFKSAITGADDVADLEKQIDDTRSAGIRGHAEMDRLEAARLAAQSYSDARAIDEQIAACRWGVEHAAAQLKNLEQRVSIARAARNRKALARHQDVARKILMRLIPAIQNAAEIQAEAVAARDAAIAELGEGAVAVAIEPTCYLGLLTPQFVAAWADSMEKRLAAAAPQPAVSAVAKPAVAPMPAKPAAKAAASIEAAAPVPVKPKREPRRDKVAPNGRLVTLMRSGVELPDGTQGVVGDVVAMLATDAERLVMSGAGDYHNAS
jgi:hypothetical protein